MANGGGQNDNSNDFFIYMLLAVVVLVGGWYFFGQRLGVVYLWIKTGEYYLLKGTLVHLIFENAWATHVAPIEYILKRDIKGPLTLEMLNAAGRGVGYFSRYYYILLLAYLTWHVVSKNPTQKFRRIHSMKTLVLSESRLWPAIAPVSKLDLIKQDIAKGPWAMSRKPYEFARYYKLLDEGNKLNRDRAEKLFAMQLGKLWEGSSKLPSYARALFACFAAQACGGIEDAKKGIDRLNISIADKKEDYSWVGEMLEKYEKDERVQTVIRSHAYAYTVMAGMLKAAREYGVMQSPLFIWLRPKNRSLWYILNGVGRRVAFAEVAGIYAHLIAEEIAGHPIERPYVVKAVDGLERALLEVKME